MQTALHGVPRPPECGFNLCFGGGGISDGPLGKPEMSMEAEEPELPAEIEADDEESPPKPNPLISMEADWLDPELKSESKPESSPNPFMFMSMENPLLPKRATAAVWHSQVFW